jgi:hypothetical protein
MGHEMMKKSVVLVLTIYGGYIVYAGMTKTDNHSRVDINNGI